MAQSDDGRDGIGVLYVDGDADRAADAATALRREGMAVEVAAVPTEATDRLDGVDCVVVEHDPPVVDGFAVLAAVADARPDIPRVLFPSGGDEGVAARAVDIGVEGYVPRLGDDDVGRLARRIEGVVADADPQPGEVDFALKERAMDEAPVGITIADADRDQPLLYVNDSFETMTGYDRDEIIGRNCRFLQGEESDPEAVAAMRRAIDAGRPVTVELLNYRADGEPFWNRVDVAPVRRDGEVTHFVGFQTDITDRVRAERRAERRAEELADERAALQRLLDRIDGLVGDVTAALVEAADRETVERRVVDRVSAAAPFVGAWIGEVDHAAEAVVPGAASGVAVADLTVPLASDDPVPRAIETGSTQVAEHPAELDDAHRDVAPASAATAAVPLTYRGTNYGVLVVYASGADAFDERETAVLAALGRVVATAMNALRTRRVLEGDATVELELSIPDRGLAFVDASARADCRLEFAGSARGPDGDQRLLFAVDGAAAGRVRDVLADHETVTAATVLTDDEDGGIVEVTLAGPSLVTELAEAGAEPVSLSADSGLGRVTLRLPADEDARALVSRFDDRYQGIDLRALRERDRPPRTRREFLADVDDALTDRQRAALRKAYVAGYFDRQRRVTGDELAESMGITRSTFHQHLRTAQRKLLDEFFERD